MPSVQTSGTYTLTASAVQVGSLAANYVAVILIDTSNLVAGDIMEIVIKTRVLSAGSDVIIWRESFSGVQADPIKQSIPIDSPYNVFFTLQSLAGGLRTIPWRIDAIA